MRWLATGQRFATISCAQWNRISARCALPVRQSHLSAWTRLHRGRHQFALITIAVVTQSVASMIATLQHLVTNFGARVFQGRIILLCARQRLFIATAITNVLNLLLTIVARATMTFALTAMNFTIQLLVALDVALQIIFLTALHHLLAAATTTFTRNRRLSRRRRLGRRRHLIRMSAKMKY